MPSGSGSSALPGSAEGSAVSASPYFEDFHVGQVFTGLPRCFPAAVVSTFAETTGDSSALHLEPGHSPDGRPLVHGSLVVAGFFGWYHELGLSEHVAAALDTHWDFLAPVHVGDSVTYQMTVTRCRRTSSLRTGVIGRHVLVRNQAGTIVQEGRTSALVHARAAVDDARQRSGTSFPTATWARGLAARLDASAEFATVIGTWDGTIGLRFGEDDVLFRVYRGRVLDCGPRVPNGPTFVIGAPDVTWTRLLTGRVNDFTERALRGEFTTSGNAYEYLRLTRAVVALVDEARAMAGADRPGGDGP